jgi:hypothetical protein
METASAHIAIKMVMAANTLAIGNLAEATDTALSFKAFLLFD